MDSSSRGHPGAAFPIGLQPIHGWWAFHSTTVATPMDWPYGQTIVVDKQLHYWDTWPAARGHNVTGAHGLTRTHGNAPK